MVAPTPYRLVHGDGVRLRVDPFAGVRVDIEAREAAAGDFEPYPVAFEEHHAGRPKLHLDLLGRASG